jgi:hypothetical protein
VDALLQTFMPQCQLPVLLVNDPTDGGSDGFFKTAIASLGGLAAEASFGQPGLLSHETGHVLANLGDEYTTPNSGFPNTEEPNTTQQTNRLLIKWKAWISPSTPVPTPVSYGDGVVGLFQGAHYHTNGWYRPELDCAMGSLGVPFCAVCSEALVLAIYQWVRPIESFSPASTNFSFSNTQALAFSLSLPQPATHNLDVQWFINGLSQTGATNLNFTLLPQSFANATNWVSAVVKDNTSLVRNDPTNLLSQTISWTLTVPSGSPTTITGQPQSCTNIAGTTATFTVSANGTVPLCYQWFKNETNALAGATNAVLSLTNVQPSQEGNYTVIITNNYGSVTSSVAVLTVIQASPVIITPPTASAITYGQTLASSVLSGGVASTPGIFAFATTTLAPNAGITNVSVIFMPTDTTNYTTTITNVNVTVNKATAAVNLINLTQIYDATAKPVSVTTTPLGLNVLTTYNGSSAAPTNAGNYTVIGTIADVNYRGSATNTLVIGQATAMITLGGLYQAYDGTAKCANFSTAPAGLSVSLTYNGSTTCPAAVGSYTVIGTVNDTNYRGSTTNTLTIAPLALTDYQSTVVSQGPVGYWRLNETTQPGTNAPTTAANVGSLGATGNGTYEGPQGLLRGFPGALANSDTAVHFNGTDQFVSVPYDAALNPSTFTIEGWLNADNIAANCALSCGTFSSPRSGWLIYQTSQTGYELRMYKNSGTAFAVDVVGTTTNVVGLYTHVVATFDGTTASIYLNGVLANSGTLNAPYVPGVSGSGFTIGERTDGGFLWAGKADEVAYYNTALDANTIAAHYACATTNAALYPTMILASSPSLYFHLHEVDNPPAANIGSLQSAANGAYTSGTTAGVAGPRPPTYPGFETTNNAVTVNGAGASVAVPALNLNMNTVTISGWIKPSTLPESVFGGIVVCDAGTTHAGLTMDLHGTGVGYVWNNDPNTYNWSPSSDSGLPLLAASDWSYVALVVQPDKAALYLCASNNPANFSGVTNFPPGGHAIQAFDGATLIGSDAGSVARSFAGAIDEVAIFNRALGEGELHSQYASAVGGLGPHVFSGTSAPVDGVQLGDTVRLMVDAGGAPALSYQWRKDATPIGGATTSAYTRVGATFGDSGTYDVVITNLFGSVTSAVVTLTVNQVTPVIIAPPTASAITYGQTLASSIVSGGLASTPGVFTFVITDLAPNAGITNVSVVFTPTDTTNYTTAITNVNVTVNKATATVTLGGLYQMYDGTARRAIANTTPPNLTVGLTYNGSANAPVNSGNYTVVGTVYDLNYASSDETMGRFRLRKSA